MSLKTSFKAGFVLLGAISIGMAAPSSTSAQSCYSCWSAPRNLVQVE